jgi:hypothetical protein
MAMALPKITYTPIGSGSVSTLVFQGPARFVAAYNRAAARHDNVSTAGAKETVVERVDEFLELTLERVNQGSDVDSWDAFMQNALQGVEFNYFPDKDLPDFATFTLEDTDWRAEYKSAGQFSFRVKFRKAV